MATEDALDRLPQQMPRLGTEERERFAIADIRTVYVVQQNDDMSGFDIYVEANVHASDVCRVFTRLAKRLIPSEAYPILVYDREEPWHGPLVPTASILAVASEFSDVIANDSFIAFGIIAYPEGRVEEIFIEEVKYLQVWINQSH